MRETERSLRAYFIFAGVVALLLSWRDWSTVRDFGFSLPLRWAVGFYIPIVTRTVVGIGFLIAGVQLPKALPTGAGWIKKLLVASALVMFLNGAIVTTMFELDAAQAGLGGAVIGLLITIYLLRSVTRLAAEAAARTGVPPAATVVQSE